MTTRYVLCDIIIFILMYAIGMRVRAHGTLRVYQKMILRNILCRFHDHTADIVI